MNPENPNPEQLRGSLVQVTKGGRGFAVRADNGTLILTAAHCLPRLPPAHPASYTEERKYQNLLGPLFSRKPTIWAAVLFVDPVADIAVLGEPDNQTLYREAETFNAFMDTLMPLNVAPPPDDSSTMVVFDLRKATPIYRDGVYRPPQHVSFGTDTFEGGMSGSPILSAAGDAIAVVSCDEFNPVIIASLPMWIVQSLTRRLQDSDQ